MKQYVQRIISLTYSPEEIRFQTGAQIDEFYRALGYMAFHGMASDHPRDIEYVSMAIDRDHEITGAYFPPWSRGDGYTENKVQYDLDSAMKAFQGGRAFVIGAVPRDGGTRYSFHS